MLNFLYNPTPKQETVLLITGCIFVIIGIVLFVRFMTKGSSDEDFKKVFDEQQELMLLLSGILQENQVDSTACCNDLCNRSTKAIEVPTYIRRKAALYCSHCGAYIPDMQTVCCACGTENKEAQDILVAGGVLQ